MPNIAFADAHALHHFDIAPTGRHLWRVEEWHGLIGGIFRTRKDALRFALFEADGDRRCVHFRRAERRIRN
jgi:hypothetical protein